MSAKTAVVARKDFEDAVRSKMLWSLTGLLVALIGLVYFGIWYYGSDPVASDVVAVLALPLQILVPISALIVGYMAVVGERRSGSLKILLGLPPTRRDVVAGKLIGRAGVVGASILAAFVVATLLSGLLIGAVPIGKIASLGLATLALGFAYVGIAVGVSAGVASRGRAMASVVGLYLLFFGFWNFICGAVYRMVEGAWPASLLTRDPVEPWAVLLARLNPLEAYSVVATELVGDAIPALTLNLPNALDPRVPGDRGVDAIVVGDAPFYLSDWFAAAILLTWFAVPVALGYLRFRGADLG